MGVSLLLRGYAERPEVLLLRDDPGGVCCRGEDAVSEVFRSFLQIPVTRKWTLEEFAHTVVHYLTGWRRRSRRVSIYTNNAAFYLSFRWWT
jgi:hypothetical protein